jgi:hypothetical protein
LVDGDDENTALQHVGQHHGLRSSSPLGSAGRKVPGRAPGMRPGRTECRTQSGSDDWGPMNRDGAACGSCAGRKPHGAKEPRLVGGTSRGGRRWRRRAVASRRVAPWGFSRTIVPMGYG